jgi:PAS domain S-box-containing protein
VPAHLTTRGAPLEMLTERDLLTLLVDRCEIGIAIVALDHRFLYVNPALAKWLGYARTELEAMTWLDVTTGGDREEDLRAIAAVIAGRMDRYEMDKDYQPRHASPFPARLTVRRIDSPAGELVAFYSQIQRIDGVPDAREDELRVVWRFVADHKRAFAVGVLFVAFAGAELVDAFYRAIATASSFLP